MVFVTDPDRTPDPVAVAETLPRHAAVIFRGFGLPGAEATARALARVARRRGLLLLVGADEGLAVRARAGGLHLPERLAHLIPALRARHPGWVLTAAAHSGFALRRAERAGADAVLLSSVFASRSGSAGSPIGVRRFGRWARRSPAPVLALGGVNAGNIARLMGTGAAGFAAVDGWSDLPG